MCAVKHLGCLPASRKARGEEQPGSPSLPAAAVSRQERPHAAATSTYTDACAQGSEVSSPGCLLTVSTKYLMAYFSLIEPSTSDQSLGSCSNA